MLSNVAHLHPITGLHELARMAMCWVVAVCALNSSPLVAAATLPDGVGFRHVVHVSLDGLGSVYLRGYVSGAPEEFPSLARLWREGACTFNARCDADISITQPNHACMFTGRPALEQPPSLDFLAPHGLTVDFDPGAPWTLHNYCAPEVPYKASTFDVVHDHGLSTAFFSGKAKLGFFVRSYDAEHGLPHAAGRNKIDRAELIDWVSPTLVRAHDAQVVSNAMAELVQTAPSYLFLHLADPDITGHFSLWGSDEYRQAVREVDAHLGRLMTLMEQDPRLRGQTALVLTSDHGGGDYAGWHIDFTDPVVYTVPLCLWGSNIPHGVDLYRLFSNRTDPGERRPSYRDPQQPLRNGDTGNIALAFLGLPAVTNSLMRPVFSPWLSVRNGAEGLLLSWPATPEIWQLQMCTAASPLDWRPVAVDVMTDQGWSFSRLPLPGADSPTYYRLARLPGR